MDITVDKIENSEALIKIKLMEVDYQPKVTQKIKDFSKKANIKGFRPGKVPPGMIKKLYGNSFLVEEVNQIVSEELNKILRERDIQFLGEPLTADKQEAIDWDNQKNFEFLFNIGYAETFELKVDKKVKMDYHSIKIDDKVLNETIRNLQNQFGEVSNPDVVGEGDTIIGTLQSADEKIDTEVSIELTELDKSWQKKVVGSKLNDQIELDAKKSFKEKDYFAKISRLTSDEIKSIKGKLTMTLTGINHTEPAAVNQDLFDKTFGKGQVDSEATFKEKVKETIAKNYASEEDHFFRHRVREKLVDITKITLPDKFLKKWLLQTNEKMTEAVLAEEYKQYANELKWSLIRNKIAKDQAIKVENDEVKEEAKLVIAQQFGGPHIAAQLGDQMNDFADRYLSAENGENYMKVYNQVQNRKVMDYAVDQITWKKKEISLDDFRKL